MAGKQLLGQWPHDCVRVLYESGKEEQLETDAGANRSSIVVTSADMDEVYADISAWLYESDVPTEWTATVQKDGMLVLTRVGRAFHGTITITIMRWTGGAHAVSPETMRIEIAGKELLDALRSYDWKRKWQSP